MVQKAREQITSGSMPRDVVPELREKLEKSDDPQDKEALEQLNQIIQQHRAGQRPFGPPFHRFGFGGPRPGVQSSQLEGSNAPQLEKIQDELEQIDEKLRQLREERRSLLENMNPPAQP